MPSTQTNGAVNITGSAYYNSTDSTSLSFRIDELVQLVDAKDPLKAETGIHPQLYFSYVKSKFKTLERMKLDSRLKKIEVAFSKAVENGQQVLASKFLAQIVGPMRESAIYAKGIKHFIEKDDLNKHKRNIRGGHISDTKLSEFTRVIPDKVLKKKKDVEAVFDDFVIYHYWNPKADNVKEMSLEEKSKMRDPVLFGTIKDSNRLYFIADWEDEFCDLTFEEIIDVLGKKEEEVTISRNPVLEII